MQIAEINPGTGKTNIQPQQFNSGYFFLFIGWVRLG
jgi:hypothetical protein